MTAPMLPPEIYVRRRVAALVIILLLVGILLGVWALLSGDDKPTESEKIAHSVSASDAASSPVSSAADGSVVDGSAADTPSAAASSSGSEDSSGSKASFDSESNSDETPTALHPHDMEVSASSDAEHPAQEKEDCTLSDLRITASSDQATYPAGVQPEFYMTVNNPTDKDCVVDLDEETLRFEVYGLATNRRIWADTDCYPAVQTGKQTFKAGTTRTFQATWSRLGSSPGQCTNRPESVSGGYYLHAVIGDNASAAYTFNLRQ